MVNQVARQIHELALHEYIETLEKAAELAVHLPKYSKKVAGIIEKGGEKSGSDEGASYKETHSHTENPVARNVEGLIRTLNETETILNHTLERISDIVRVLNQEEPEVKAQLASIKTEFEAVHALAVSYEQEKAQRADQFNPKNHLKGQMLKTLVTFKASLTKFKISFQQEGNAVFNGIRRLVRIEGNRITRIGPKLQEKLGEIPQDEQFSMLREKLELAISTVSGWERSLNEDSYEEHNDQRAIEVEIDEVITALNHILGDIETEEGLRGHVNEIKNSKSAELEALHAKIGNLMRDEASFYKILVKIHQDSALFYDSLRSANEIVENCKSTINQYKESLGVH